KRISASDAKNNFGGLLEDVASLGRVEIVKHGRLVAVVLSPGALEESVAGVGAARSRADAWGRNHMIHPKRARAARMLSVPSGFDED
ncbi:MAG: type II toxin-antitoxin system prevent-host-death family antitoxin, partial [Nevskiaceae bacterium]|nr:type II toxin-antitoxin system prevent-host-death family antitoxin [Nevskiaceae bacterium]